MTDQTGYRTNYFYDAQGRLSRLTDTSGVEIVRYTYDAGDRLVRTDKGNGTYTINAYDAAGQLISLANYAPNGLINSRFDYEYDALGRRTSQNTIDGRWAYVYDSSGRLTAALFTPTPVSSVPSQSIAYVYDAVGNRIRVIENGAVTQYVTNNLNQYTNVGDDVLTYDADGNIRTRIGTAGTFSYTFDQLNRLTSYSSLAQTTQFGYNFRGNVSHIEDKGDRASLLIDPIGLGYVVGESRFGGAITHSIFGIGLVGQQDSTTTDRRFFAFDGVGSTADVTNGAAQVIATNHYDPYWRNRSNFILQQ